MRIMGSELWTTIGIKKATKAKLDGNRAPGQNNDGFIWQLVDLWEKTKASLEETGTSGKNYNGFIWQLVDSGERAEKVGAGTTGGNQSAEAVRSQTA